MRRAVYEEVVTSCRWLGLLGIANAVRIEQAAGYYECPNCGHRYVPSSYGKVLWVPHMGRSWKMSCPACGERGWHKKVLTKE